MILQTVFNKFLELIGHSKTGYVWSYPIEIYDRFYKCDSKKDLWVRFNRDEGEIEKKYKGNQIFKHKSQMLSFAASDVRRRIDNKPNSAELQELVLTLIYIQRETNLLVSD